MPIYLSDEKKTEIITEFGGSESNTGAVQVQIAIFTHRIKGLSNHLKENKKDNSTKRSLLTMVGKRKKLLKYYQAKNIEGYRSLIEKLGIRK